MEFSSDDEKALTKAIEASFPLSERDLSTKHLKDNLKHFMSNVAAVKPDDRYNIELKTEDEATQFMCTVSIENGPVNQPTARSIVEHTIKSEVMETAKLNLDCENESKVHLFAKVNWLAPLPDRYRYHCGKPVEVWSREIHGVFGPSAFIPVQKIYGKYVRADGKLSEKLESYICPLNSGMNI
ncbi:Hypothetical predicted protein [Mytilus galloprovincialis]|uniref:Uncharacterized protein n=1 Tax=Mytilus galloprovincialis TaxID=29158 RepID=A0A8B6E3D0_MYTGA|nr:Hypothetical predicted protein [Mytilus galloprovincialis]